MDRTEHLRIWIALIIAAFFLKLYIEMLSGDWDFGTLRSADGRPIGLDFANFWAAAKLALSGQPILAYNNDALYEIECQFLGGHHQITAFYYSPSFLLMILPLALMPYLTSLSIWLGLTFLLYSLILIKISPSKLLIPFFMLFPGIFINIKFGQNAFLSGFLLGAGLLLLNNSPIIAGCLFGFLSYKPQFVALILIALLMGRYWKVLVVTIVTTIFMSIISAIVFGHEVWVAYFNIMPIPMKLVESGQTAWSIMPTFFVATLSAGFSVKAAYLVQAIVMLVALIGVAWVWWKTGNLALKGTILTLGLLLFTPYAHIYELAILALPLCWLWEDGSSIGWPPGEFLLLLCTWLMPFFMPFLWFSLDIFYGKLQIGPLFLMMLFLLTLIRVNGWPRKAHNRNGSDGKESLAPELSMDTNGHERPIAIRDKSSDA